MPKSAVIDENAAEGAVVHSAENGINTAELKAFVALIEDEQVMIDDIMAAAQKHCQPHIDEIKAIKKKAAEAGIDKKPLSAKLRERTLLRKAEHVTDSLNDDQKDIFEEITAKLGDMPVFKNLND